MWQWSGSFRSHLGSHVIRQIKFTRKKGRLFKKNKQLNAHILNELEIKPIMHKIKKLNQAEANEEIVVESTLITYIYLLEEGKEETVEELWFPSFTSAPSSLTTTS